MRIIFLLFLLMSFTSAVAQDTLKWLSVGFNTQAYKGDLGDKYSKWTGGLYTSLQFKTQKKWNGSVNLIIGNVTGQDLNPVFNVSPESGRQPNTYFNNSFVAAYYQLHWNVYLRSRLRVFLGQGIGLMRYNAKDEQGVSLANQTNTRAANESAGNIALLLPTSIGTAYRFKNNFGVSYKFTLLNTATDYLDNISQLGGVTGGDNVLAHQVSLLVPIYF
jgi:hypothetical protein